MIFVIELRSNPGLVTGPVARGRPARGASCFKMNTVIATTPSLWHARRAAAEPPREPRRRARPLSAHFVGRGADAGPGRTERPRRGANIALPPPRGLRSVAATSPTSPLRLKRRRRVPVELRLRGASWTASTMRGAQRAPCRRADAARSADGGRSAFSCRSATAPEFEAAWVRRKKHVGG